MQCWDSLRNYRSEKGGYLTPAMGLLEEEMPELRLKGKEEEVEVPSKHRPT